jgi:hypothetical protein
VVNVASAVASNRSSAVSKGSKQQKSEASLSRSESKHESVEDDASVSASQEPVNEDTTPMEAAVENIEPTTEESVVKAEAQNEEIIPPTESDESVGELDETAPTVPESEASETATPSEDKPQSTPPTTDPTKPVESNETPTSLDTQDEINVHINTRMHVQSQEDLEDDYNYCDDQVNITTVATRLIESPLPSSEDDGFMFINVDYEADPDLPVLKMCSGLSRSASWDWGLEKALHGDELILVDVCATPIMRPSTPVAFEYEDLVEVEMDAEEVKEVVPQQQFEGLNIDMMLPDTTEDLDREDIIQQIRDLIDMRDKYMAKNANYQNLLGEYFRRKRVWKE